MSKKQYIKRQILIIKKLQQRALTFEEIQNYLKIQSQLDEENYELSIRTFQRDCKEIASIFNLEIKYNRTLNKYEIPENDLEIHHERMIESLELYNALNLESTLSKHIFLESRKSLGTENMHDLLHAIKNHFEITFTHEKFWDEQEKTKRTAKPIALKEAKSRWYLLCMENNKIKTFGLDRISDLNITSQKFESIDNNPDEIFNNSFGIIIEEKAPQKIILSYSKEQGKYVKSFPLHHSQKEITDSEKEYRIELLLHPTYDFVMELLSVGSEVKVIEPKNLQEEIKLKLKATLALYQ